MSDHPVFTPEQVADWAALRPELARWGSVERVSEIGDGNLNNVFRVHCGDGSFVVKQSMPYVRIDPTWALSSDRIRHEAFAYAEWNRLIPGLCPHLYSFDAEHCALAVEDLVGFRVWRYALLDDEVHPEVAEQLGRFIAHSATRLASEEWAPEDRDVWMGKAENPVMTQLMSDVVFRFPYEDHPHNAFIPAVSSLVEEIRADAAYRAGVTQLHEHWSQTAEALLHGDLHTGSVMVNRGAVRIIDSEFSWYGPVAWDIGELLGNLLIAAIRGRVLDSATVPLLDRLAPSAWSGFAEAWDQAAAEETRPGLDRIGAHALGYAGLEMVRRVIGSGKAEEIEALAEPQRARASTVMLRAGRELVLRRGELSVTGAAEIVAAMLEDPA